MTLSDLLDALYQDLGYEAIPSATVTKRLTRFINEGYRLVLSMPEMGPIRSGTLAFVSVAGKTTYGFPQAFVSIDQMVDTTNNVRLRLMTQDQFRTIDPQEVSSGTPTHYVPLGLSPVATQPPETPLWVVSTSALDVTQTVSVFGMVVGGVDTGLNVPVQTATLNGLTPVPVGLFTTWVLITQWELSAPAAGVVSLADSAAATISDVLGQIPTGYQSIQYQTMRLWPTPAGVYDYQVDGSLVMTDLGATLQIPILPPDFHFMLADYARMKEFGYRDDPRYAMAKSEYEQKLKYLRDRLIDPPDYRPRAGKFSGSDGTSNLGSYFPVGRW